MAMSTSTSQQPGCFVCRKHQGLEPLPGGPAYEDELVFAGHAGMSQGQSDAYLGALLIEPKRHVEGLDGLSDAEAQRIGLLAARLSRALKEVEGAEHIYAFVLGHSGPHLHVWLVPRYPGTPREYWGQRVDEWPDAPRGNAQEVAALVARLRAYLEVPDLGSYE